MKGTMPKIDLRPDHWRIVQSLLQQHVPDWKVVAFGSRATWTARDYSDLDLAILGDEPLPLATAAALAEGFEESELPFKVDIVDWATTSETFRETICRDGVLLQAAARAADLEIKHPCAKHRKADKNKVSQFECAWQKLPFTEAFHINPPVKLRRGSSYPYVDMASINPGCRFVASSVQRQFSGSGARFMDGDTLLARITPCLENGKIARYLAREAQQAAYGSTEFIVIRGRSGFTDNKFAFYMTRSRTVRDFAIGQMTGTSGRQRVPVEALADLIVDIPPLPEQRAIAAVLGAFDDKIELNRRMNETLEAMAQAIFRDWFVDFGPTRARMAGQTPYLSPELWDLFPDTLDDEDKPKGWELQPLEASCFEIIGWGNRHRGALTIPEYCEWSVPWFSIIDTPAKRTSVFRSSKT